MNKVNKEIIEWGKKEIQLYKSNLIRNDHIGAESRNTIVRYMNDATAYFESLCYGNSRELMLDSVNILNKIVRGNILTPITDNDDDFEDEWRFSRALSDNTRVYQSKRLSSLFKYLYSNGDIRYRDLDRIKYFNTSSYCEPPVEIHSSVVIAIVEKYLKPITMPYMPSDPINIYYEEFSIDKDAADIDTVGILGTSLSSLNMVMHKYYKYEENSKSWVLIDVDEYYKRKILANNNKNKEGDN